MLSVTGESIISILMGVSINSDMLHSITPWIINMGLQNAFIVAAFAGLIQVLTVFFFIRYGERLRQASVDRYLHYKEEMVLDCLDHSPAFSCIL